MLGVRPLDPTRKGGRYGRVRRRAPHAHVPAGPRARSGQGLVEYGLIIVLIAIAVITLIALLGGQVANVYSRITTSLA